MMRKLAALLLVALIALPTSALAQEGFIPIAEDGLITGFSEETGDGFVPEEPQISDETEEPPEEMPSDADSFAAEYKLLIGGDNKYMEGDNGYFRPEKQMTRAEFATVVHRLLETKPTPKADTFSDVKTTSWYATAVNSLAAAKIMNGYSDGTFKPAGKITRAEVVTTFAAFFKQGTGSIPYTDVPSNQWYYRAVITAHSLGWIEGDGSGKFRPNDPIKRCEVVKIANRVLEREVEKGAEIMQKFPDVPRTHWAYYEINEAADNPTEYVPPEDPPGDVPPSGNLLIVTGDGVRLRSGPGTTYSILETMNKGTILTALDKSNDEWYKVRTNAGREGYAFTEYLETYTGSVNGTGEISASSANVPQYKTIFLYAQVNGSPTNSRWKSSNESIASVKPVSGRGFIYAKAQGTATISLLDATDKVIDTCEITVTKPEAVRFTYAEPNTPTKGQDFYIYAITDTSRSSVRFALSGAANGTKECTTYSTETRKNNGYDDNTVRVFKQKLTIDIAGDYVIKAYSKDSSGAWSTDYAQFNMLVKNSGSLSVTTTEERSVSAEMVEVIGSWEGARNLVYIDELSSSKVPTVGYGYTLDKNETFYNSLTQSELRAMLQDTLNNDGYVRGVKDFQKKNGIKMNQYQFDALVSFAYNLGPGVLSSSYDTFKVLMNASSKTSGSGKLDVTAMPMYSSAAKGTPIATVPSGTSVTVQEIKRIDGEADNLWYKISYDGKTGWIRGGGVDMGTSSPDLQYIDEQMFGSNMLQWISAGGTKLAGLLYRRLAEAKVFCYGGYADAMNTSANKDNRHNFGLDIPSGVSGADIIED